MRNDDQKTSLILSICGILPDVYKRQTLQYAPKNNVKKIQEIVIVREDNRLLTIFEGQKNTIEINTEIIKESRGKDRDFERARYYFNRCV